MATQKGIVSLPSSGGEAGLNRYLAEIKKFPILSPEEEYMLAKRWREHGDTDAAAKLVNSHLRLVAKIAMGYRGYGLPVSELISEGNIGLMQGVKKFEPDRGFRLATYAMWWIRASIQEFILRSWSLVKMGTTAAQKKLFFNLRRMKNQIEAFEEGDLKPADVAEELGIPLSAFGPVLSAGLVGLMIGAMSAGPIADRWGRRWAIIVSALVYMTNGVSSYFTSLYALPIIAASTIQSQRSGMMVCVLSSVMYAGVVAEFGATRRVFDTPLHPYSVGLLEAFPSIRGPRVPLTGIPGSPPNLASIPPGCRFAPRCPKVMARCEVEHPELYQVNGTLVRCFLHEGEDRAKR